MTDVYPTVEWVLESESATDYSDPIDRYKREDGEWKDGVRPAHVIESVDDVEWGLKLSDAKQPNLVCFFCGADRQVRTLDEGRRWFLTHPCEGERAIDQWLAA